MQGDMTSPSPAAAIRRRPGVTGGRSSACAYGGLAWAVATDTGKAADVAEQVRASLAKIDRLLGEVGSRRGDILSATLYLTDNEHRAAMDQVWRDWVGDDPAHWPQRACVLAGLSPGTLFEIAVVAAATAADPTDGSAGR